MNADKMYSAFKFIDSRITKLYTTNNFVKLPQTDVGIKLNYTLSEIDNSEEVYFGTVQLELIVTIKEKGKNIFKLTMIVEGGFAADVGSMPIENFKKMLEINGVTTTYSIARANLITISSMLFVEGQLRLPMVNILELVKSKNQKMQEKE